MNSRYSNHREPLYRNWILYESFFLLVRRLELDLIPTQTVTGQYISLLFTRRHFFNKRLTENEETTNCSRSMPISSFKKRTTNKLKSNHRLLNQNKGHRIVRQNTIFSNLSFVLFFERPPSSKSLHLSLMKNRRHSRRETDSTVVSFTYKRKNN